MEMMVNSAFEHGLYSKLEPVLLSIANVGVDIKNINNKMDILSFKLEEMKMGNEMQGNVHSRNLTIKSIFMLNISLAVIVFLSMNPMSGTHYILAVVYLAWWLLLTSEFKLFNNKKAWNFCFGIIILIPISTILLNSIFNMRVMMAVLFSGIAVFAIFYYIWCNLITKGELPFNIHNDLKIGIKEIQNHDHER
jgi:hypothetical protein